jgi:hypothetical protein
MSDSDNVYASGSCQCGGITYDLTEPPVATYVCYCTECQKLSAGMASTTMALRREAMILRSGSLKRWERMADSGNRNVAWFCPDCGNRIYHENPAAPAMIRLKTGTLEDQSVVRPMVHFWTVRKPDWLPLPEFGLVYETQDTEENVMAALQELQAQGNA